MNLIGTYLDNGTEYPEWVGSPLLVHRRCISPMYDISNEISYNGIMKQQTAPPKAGKKFARQRSEWINVAGKEADEVIFLLGCDDSREAKGAVRWVNANIVNVAATRAKYRLYVIGDANVWKNSACVSKAKEIMDHKEASC